MSTVCTLNDRKNAAFMFARWSHYFAYMLNLDRLIDYGTEEFPRSLTEGGQPRLSRPRLQSKIFESKAFQKKG